MQKKEYVKLDDPKLPTAPPTWFPINRKKGKVTMSLTCNKPPKDGKVVGTMKFSGKPCFSPVIVTFYKEEE